MEIPKIRRRKIDLVKSFIESDVWTWLKGHLETQQRKLIALVADPRLNAEQRALCAGQLGMISAILVEPERITQVADRAEASVSESRERSKAPFVTPD